MPGENYKLLKKYDVPGFEPKLKNQGGRGTCVAMAVTTLMEYCRRSSGVSFSPQYLYARCKQEDNAEAPGTDIEHAFRCAIKYGICAESEWPYNLNPTATEAQAAPDQLDGLPTEDLSGLRYRMLLTPGNVDEYKSILCGAGGNAPVPIVVGCKVFKTGIVSDNFSCALKAPEPADREFEGHAMLIYGWKDTPGLDSKGYFKAQNSWKTIQHVPGTIHIPYEYIAEYAAVAGTVVLPPTAKPENDGVETPRTTGAVPTAKVPAEDPAAWSPSAGEISVKDRFFSSQLSNLKESNYPLPELRPSYFRNIFMRSAKFADMSVDDLSNSRDLADFIKTAGRENDLKLWVKVFRIPLDSRGFYLLVSAFMSRRGEAKVDANDVALLRKYFSDIYLNGFSDRDRPLHSFFTIGTAGEFADDCEPIADPTVFLCMSNPGDIWYFKLPALRRSPCAEEFFRHILPGTKSEYAQAVKAKLDLWSENEYITVPALKERLLGDLAGKYDIYDITIATALDELFKTGKYAKDKSGKIFPASWKLPRGAKLCRRYSKPFAAMRFYYNLLSVIVFLMPVVSYIVLHLAHAEHALYISLGFTVVSFWIAWKKQKFMLILKYNI